MSFADDLRKAMAETAKQKPRAVKVKPWGTVYIRDVTVAEVDAQTEDTADAKDKRRLARGAARVICDPDGKRIYDPDNDTDVALLASQPWPLLRKVLQDEDSGN
jgi:hypothetical protein